MKWNYFSVKSKCSIFRVENDNQINGLSFEANSISKDGLTYEWSRIRDGQQSVLFKSGIQNNGLESYLTLNPLQENIGTYTCRVSNSAGADISCEIEVHAKKGMNIHNQHFHLFWTGMKAKQWSALVLDPHF